MKEVTRFKSERIKFSQQALLIFSSVIFIFFSYYLFSEFSGSMVILFLIAILLLGYINYFQRRFFDINIENDTIFIDNIWEKKAIPLADLRNIRQYEFILPFLVNPFLEFKIEGQKKVITQVPFIIREYIKKGGIKAYIEKLKTELIIKKVE